MRPRTELALAGAAFVAVMLVALAAGRDRSRGLTSDTRSSSLSNGPNGTRALAEVIVAAGGDVTRWRDRLSLIPDTALDGSTVAVINPPMSVAHDVSTLIGMPGRGANLFLAGPATLPLVRCLGFAFDSAILDSARLVGADGRPGPGVITTLTVDTTGRRKRDPFTAAPTCPDIAITSQEVLLRTTRNLPVLVRLEVEDAEGSILVLSDAGVIGTRGLGVPGAPEVVIGALVARSRRVIFDEFHHVGPGGSMWRSAMAWTRRSPWGWAMWQVSIVAFLAWVAGSVRFGPVRRRIARERRSPLEHVRALATALSASNGHDVAIGALVRGLQRRLAAGGGDRRRAGAGRAAWLPFVEVLVARAPDAEARRRAARLVDYARPGQPDIAVRGAANAVEDVWDALHR
ncbi:MAG: DUF4350 domain-containing protein [Gemmatimonadaceae bacterium]|nr:DUF4350 domain-containing protein [Gemmatimonadaceae bacterium]